MISISDLKTGRLYSVVDINTLKNLSAALPTGIFINTSMHRMVLKYLDRRLYRINSNPNPILIYLFYLHSITDMLARPITNLQKFDIMVSLRSNNVCNYLHSVNNSTFVDSKIYTLDDLYLSTYVKPRN
jgi:hypothetical protein